MNSNNKLKQELLETAKAPLQNDVMCKELTAAAAEALSGGGGKSPSDVPADSTTAETRIEKFPCYKHYDFENHTTYSINEYNNQGNLIRVHEYCKHNKTELVYHGNIDPEDEYFFREKGPIL